MCLRSSDPFYIVSKYINWDTTSWTHSSDQDTKKSMYKNGQDFLEKLRVCPRSLYNTVNIFPVPGPYSNSNYNTLLYVQCTQYLTLCYLNLYLLMHFIVYP